MEVRRGGIYLYEPPKASNSSQAAILNQFGSEQAGFRPFVVLSRDIVNKSKPTAVGVPLTTRLSKANSYRILIPVGEMIKDLGCTYQFQDSVALCDHVRVLDISLIRRKVGMLSENAVLAVQLGLAFVFDIR